MDLSKAIQVLQQEQEWYYQTSGKCVMVNNASLHQAIEIVLDELGKTMTIKCDANTSMLEQKLNELKIKQDEHR